MTPVHEHRAGRRANELNATKRPSPEIDGSHAARDELRVAGDVGVLETPGGRTDEDGELEGTAPGDVGVVVSVARGFESVHAAARTNSKIAKAHRA